MNLFDLSNQSFNAASIFYFVAFLLYAGQLVSTKKVYLVGGPWAARSAFALHTAALGLRWAFAGIAHPPWTNLYESLVFFSWGVMGAHLFLEWRSKYRFTGAFASAVVFVAMGNASLHPNKEIEPLVPALQSWWLLIHVFMACIAYAFFLASSFASVLYLLKSKVRLETMAGVACLVCILFLSIAMGKTFFKTSEIQFFKVAPMAGPDGVMKDVIMNFKSGDGKDMQQFVSLPGAPYIVWPLLALYLAAAGLWLGFRKKQKSFEKYGKIAFFAALLVHVGLLADIVLAPAWVSGLALKSNPYRLAAVVMTLVLAGFFALLFFSGKKLVSRLPDAETLDRWVYETVLLGVPFMTLNLVTGAVWAYYAWGRYWGWDPKETWALITWFVYLIFLHMRMLAGWEGRKTAYISIAGFFVVIFTYLGVNLVISGLHSYATG